MEMIKKEMLNTIGRQIYNRSRDIDVAIYNALVDPECKEFVLDCLYLYVNVDGGFGNGLEIDNYNTASSVYQVYEAFRIISMLGFDSNCDNKLYTDIVNRACNFLFNKCKLDKNRWNPVIPSNNNFAHSEEYSYNENVMDRWQFHPTAALLGYILEFVNPEKAYYKKAIRMLKPTLEYFKGLEVMSEYDFISYNTLLGSFKKLGIYEEEAKLIENKLMEYALKVKDVKFDFAYNLSNCNLNEELKEKVDACLDNKINSIAPHGLWEYNKDWGNDIYPEAESAKLKWLGARSVYELSILLKYNRVEK